MKIVNNRPADTPKKRPVMLKEVIYQTNGGIRFNGVLCDPRKVQWSQTVEGIEKVLTIKALSEEMFPLSFECRSRRNVAGTYDERNRIIQQFMQKIGIQIFRRNIVSGIYEGNPPFISPPNGFVVKKGEGVLLTTNNIDLVQQTTRTVNYIGGMTFKTSKDKKNGETKRPPVKETVKEVIDNGSIVLTNKRLVFIGMEKTITTELEKIAEMENYSDALYITREGLTRKLCFTGLDGNTYYGVIIALCSN